MNDQTAVSEVRLLLEAEGFTGYLRHLTFFICVCTLFEGYGTLIISLALPYLGRDFQADAQTLGFAVSVISLGTIAATVTSEIFPTSMRATANAVVNNLLGRTGMVIAPALVGLLSPLLGSVGNAVALLALVSFLCIPVVIFLLPETKRQVLEEIIVG